MKADRMRKNQRMRLLARCAALFLAVVLIPANVIAEQEAEPAGSGLTYELFTDTETGETVALITGGTPVKDLVIPAETDGYPVYGVGAGFAGTAKEWRTILETLTVEEGVREIGEAAFEHCTALREISLPGSLVSVGEAAFINIASEGIALPEAAMETDAFRYCSGIRRDQTGAWEYALLEDGTAVITGFVTDGDSLDIPGSVDGIPVSAVARVSPGKPDYAMIRRISRIDLPQGIKALWSHAFEYCAITQITLPDSLETIGSCAFKDCQVLEEIHLPESIRHIGNSAFEGCLKLTLREFPSVLETIGDRAFRNCRKLEQVAFPESVRAIGSQAFSYCGMTEISLGEGLEEIGDNAFYKHNCTELTIPAGVKRIGNAAFAPNENVSLKTVTICGWKTVLGKGVFGYDNGLKDWSRANGGKANNSGTMEYDKENPDNWKDYYAAPGNYGQKTITLNCFAGSTADQLYQYYVKKVFMKAGTKSAVTAPSDRVLQAGWYQEEDPVSVLIIPEGVEEIADRALAGMSSIQEIRLPSTLIRIGSYAFEQCSGVSLMELPAGVNDIGEGAFRNCYELTKINIPDGITAINDFVFENCKKLSSIKVSKKGFTRIGKAAFSGCKALTAFPLNKGLEEIGESAFAGSSITGAQIPDTVISLEKSAFARSSIKTLKLPAGLEKIPDQLCEFATELSSVKFPKTVRQIGKRAFSQCRLTSLALPEGLVSIGEEAFAFDKDSVTAYHNRYIGKKTMSKLKSLKLPASLETIGDGAFAGCDALTSISFAPKGKLTRIGSEAFAMCYHLTKVVLPNSLQAVGKSAFMNCRKMTSADLGKGLTELGDEAFCSCPALNKVTAPDSLTVIGADVLKNHLSGLKVTCGENSAMHIYMKQHYPDVGLVLQKKK